MRDLNGPSDSLSNDVASIRASLSHIAERVDELRTDHKDLTQAIQSLDTRLALVQQKQNSGIQMWDWATQALITAVIAAMVAAATAGLLATPTPPSASPQQSHLGKVAPSRGAR